MLTYDRPRAYLRSRECIKFVKMRRTYVKATTGVNNCHCKFILKSHKLHLAKDVTNCTLVDAIELLYPDMATHTLRYRPYPFHRRLNITLLCVLLSNTTDENSPVIKNSVLSIFFMNAMYHKQHEHENMLHVSHIVAHSPPPTGCGTFGQNSGQSRGIWDD